MFSIRTHSVRDVCHEGKLEFPEGVDCLLAVHRHVDDVGFCIFLGLSSDDDSRGQDVGLSHVLLVNSGNQRDVELFSSRCFFRGIFFDDTDIKGMPHGCSKAIQRQQGQNTKQ